jgi:outer membrane receptor protein involved in Fe transport
MTSNTTIRRAVRFALASSAAAAAIYGAPTVAQDAPPQEEAADVGTIVVTGSRIQRPDYSANSPIRSFPAEQVVRNADITLDTFLNSLPQVNPAGTTTSNNPGNGGQSNVDLGLGANRNLVLLDGRRAMPSASDLSVDINTIPQAMIESIEIVTGGASAVYGADAVTGAVNFKLKENFEGADLRYSYSNSTEEWDAQEYVFSGVLGGNFSDNRGNAVVGFDYAKREQMIKEQRPFAAQATSTTTFLPEGNYIPGSNAPPQAAVDAVFANYGVAAGAALPTTLGFNTDGTLYSRGIFNSPFDVQNWRYPVDLNVATKYFPDFHSYNFDSVNILTLPLERRSFLGKLDYEVGGGVDIFGQVGWTEYSSTQALAATPFPTVTTRAPGFSSPTQATSALVAPGASVSNALIVPVTNPWIPTDFATLLASRTGDNASLVGSGATEPFLMRQRSISAGLRTSDYENTVVQYMVGARGDIGENWGWELYGSEGNTEIDQKQGGNLDTNRLLALVSDPVLEAAQCGPTGFNIFGRNPLSQSCVDYITVSSTLSTTFRQQILEGFVRGNLFDMPAGPLAVVFGLQGRWFDYELDPGPSAGPISGFNAQSPSKGNNSFEDIYMEAMVPILKDAPLAQSLDFNFGYRLSTAQFEDEIKGIKPPSDDSDAYFASLSWQPLDWLRVRTGFQRAVRAPNFAELFDGSGSAPQYFDPCSVTTDARNGPNGAAVTQLCLDAGGNGGVDPLQINNYVQTPGNQISITTSGNSALKPETGDSFNFGLIFDWGNLQAALDYSQIEVTDPIITPAPNVLVADCYNYYGTNPNYDPNRETCQGIIRFGGDIIFLSSPADPTGAGLYPGINGGKIKGDSLDLQVNWRVDVPGGDLALNLLATYLLSAETQEAPGLPLLDYKGTVTFFGAGLGSSAPEMKANLNAVYTVGDFAFDGRVRWIDSMENRAAVIFPGETSFTGVPSVTYLDIGASWRFMGNSQLRLGVNNVTDEQPPEYAPNVQSGTESSLYDVIGRRIFGQVVVQF